MVWYQYCASLAISIVFHHFHCFAIFVESQSKARAFQPERSKPEEYRQTATTAVVEGQDPQNSLISYPFLATFPTCLGVASTRMY